MANIAGDAWPFETGVVATEAKERATPQLVVAVSLQETSN